MDQKRFDQLLKRYLEGDASEEERALVDRWYGAIEHASSGITSTERSVIRKRLQAALKSHKDKTRADNAYRSSSRQTFFMPWNGLGLRIAASITVILAVAVGFLFTPFSANEVVAVADAYKNALADPNKNEWKRVENTSQYAHVITLQDGSEITLEAGGLLEYPLYFDSLSRAVRLKKGRAFFSVTRNEKRPFYVYAHDVVTRVLGTSFMINSDQEGHVTVDVKTGSVSVSALPEAKDVKSTEIVLTPNQRADYDPDRNKIVRTVVDNPEALIPSPEVGNMTFEKAPITAVFEAVEKAYHLEIVFDEKKFSSCVLTTYLIRGENLDTRLRIICEAIDAAYRVENGKVIVSGKGCERE